MAFSKIVIFFFLCLLHFHFMVLTIAQPVMLYHDCVGKGNYSTNSIYQKNLNTLLTSIYTNTEIDYGFYNFSHGENPDTVYAIALCRPDISADSCRACMRNASDSLLALCPNFKEAIGGQDNCMVRYSYLSIFGLMEKGPYFWVYRLQNVTDVSGFNLSRMTLLNKLRDQAATGDSRYKYAMDQIAAPDFQTIYALVQCTPDLSQSECRDCLYNASGLIRQCCEVRSGGRVYFPSCNFRYETDRFYSPVPDSTALPPPPPPPTKAKRTIIVIVVLAISVSAILAISIFIFLRSRNRNEEFKGFRKFKKLFIIAVSEIEDVESLQLEFETVRTATDDFSEANKLGQGGFGSVYKGTLPNGQDIAVKRLSRESGQGEQEFKNEVLLLAKLQHRNLVRLLGFCFENEEKLLVYEFVPNSSLNNFIFDPDRRAHLGWETRYKIIIGIARGLVYLHEDSRLRIIHRDLKASNILLDEEMNPKISDFGMARLFDMNQTQDETSRIVGTFGYMAPEYITRGHFSMKSDVFSFGVLVLEIVSSQKNSGVVGEEEEDLLTYAWRNWNEGTALNLIDPTMTVSARSEMMRCINIGLLCVQEKEVDRPTMGQVTTMLSSYSTTLQLPLKPAFFMHGTSRTQASWEQNSTFTESDGLQSNEAQQSINEVSISDEHPR